MALEKYFYQRLEEGKDITKEVATTLARCRSVAPLGVLCDVGKRQIDLLSGPLRALLSAPELYSWEIAKTFEDRNHLMLGAARNGQFFIELARQFHGLEHRKQDLRETAAELLLKSRQMQTFSTKIRDWWKQRRASGESRIEIVDQLDLTLDLSNYEVQ